MQLEIFQIDAFASEVFAGNPAAVVPLDNWLPDELMQNIALENNLSETAFYIPEGDGFHIRWFTPSIEVDLCGHATLATAYVIFNFKNYEKQEIHFNCRSGALYVKKEGDAMTMNFPADEIKVITTPSDLAKALNAEILECYKGRNDFLAIVADETTLAGLQPDIPLINQLESRGLIVSAKGDSVDFVSRGFFPQAGVDEDPVTGSAHTTLTPYWSKRLGKTELSARQISQRGGNLQCRLDGSRVHISGKAVAYLQGVINI